jgi:hypothetical protein
MRPDKSPELTRFGGHLIASEKILRKRPAKSSVGRFAIA